MDLQILIKRVEDQIKTYQERQTGHRNTFDAAQQQVEQSKSGMIACAGAIEECNRMLADLRLGSPIADIPPDSIKPLLEAANGKSVPGAVGTGLGSGAPNVVEFPGAKSPEATDDKNSN